MSSTHDTDVKALEAAFGEFTKTTAVMEEAYRRLEARIELLDRELAEKNRELELTNDYLNYIMESMSDGVIAVDTRQEITRFNRAASIALGYDAPQVVGRSFKEVFGRDFDAPPGGRHPMDLRTRDGRLLTVSECDSPISDNENRRIGTVKVFEDLTELEELKQRVRQKDRLAALGEMAATVAHEIRNPLGGLKGHAALLARDIDKGDAKSRLVSRILDGASQLEHVVSELLEYTRPVKLMFDNVNCADTIEAVLRYLRDKPENISVETKVGPSVIVRADAIKLRQALLNIVQNAVQSIENEGKVVIECESDGGSFVLSVKDNGKGIEPDLLEKVFTPFYTTREKGTGLGLAVASKIIEAHGGKLWAESVPGNGTAFYVRLQKAT